MSDAEGTSEGVAPEAAPSSGPEPTETTAPQGGGHPAFDGIRSKLGPSYSLVENDLREWDRQAQERVTRSNAEIKRYQELGDYQALQQARQLQQLVASNPMDVYTRLQAYLQQQGQLEAQSQESEGDEFEVESDTDRRLAELQQSQQGIQEFLATQQRQQQESAALKTFEGQMTSLRQQNPHFTDADENRIYRMAYANAVSTDSEPNLAAAAAELNSLRTELLSAPRAGAQAPRLVPQGGGQPPRGQAPDFGSQNRQQTQQSVVEMLKANKAAQGY